MAEPDSTVVSLHRLEAVDREPFLAAMRASERLHQPWVSPPTTPQAFEALLQRTGEDSFAVILVRLGDGDIAGYFELSQIVRGAFQNAYLGYGAVAAHARQGHMSAGLELLLDWVFGALGLHRIEANIQPGNEASIALVRRAGFVREGFSERYLKLGGEWRDHERWAIRAEQRQPGQRL